MKEDDEISTDRATKIVIIWCNKDRGLSGSRDSVPFVASNRERKEKKASEFANKVISKDTYVCVHIFKISGFSFLSLEVTVSRCTAPWPPRRRNEPPPRAWLMDLWWQKFTDQTCLAFVQFSETILALGSERERERKKKRCKGQGSIYLVGPGRDRPTRCSNNDKPHPGPSFGQWVTRCTPPRPSFSWIMAHLDPPSSPAFFLTIRERVASPSPCLKIHLKLLTVLQYTIDFSVRIINKLML